MNKFKSNLRRRPEIVGGIGILITCGLIIYEKRRIHRLLKQLMDEKVTRNEKKPRPDYIYIKYHIYKESMRKLRQEEEDERKWINVIINPIGKWWKTAKHSVAWRLLKIAQYGSHHERLKAIRQLARIDHLKDWDFRHLAQICDARTAVSLARSGADIRWFIPVHKKGCIKNPKLVLSELHDLLASMKNDKCIKYFFQKHFPEQDTVEDICEFFTQEQLISLNVQDTDMLKELIAFLHHITKNIPVAEEFLTKGGLLHLMELRKIFNDDNETLSTLCKVLANLSLAKNCVEHFFVSGWIGVLAEWQQCMDLRLQVISAKTMANLDHDDPNYTPYPPNVYPLHPRSRTRHKPKADIVFVHGLMGGVFITWRQKDRTPTELGLYGKNAFYTSDTDDVFLMSEQKRSKVNSTNSTNPNNRQNMTSKTKERRINDSDNNSNNNQQTKEDKDKLLKAAIKPATKEIQISDLATKELMETLRDEAELDANWEVVHPDIPLSADEFSSGEFSVAGNKWLNQDNDEDYTNCWPMEWLPEDHPNTRVIGIDYTSALTEWSLNFIKYCPCEKGQGHIEIRADTLKERLAMAEVGRDRPIVWIGHSMGGLLTKLILMKAKDDSNPKIRQLAKNTRSIVFLGTPHRGSPIAKWKQHMQLLLSPSIEVKEMEEGAPKLLQLHAEFMQSLKTYFRQVKIVSVAEGSPTMLTTFKFPLHIVKEESACIGYGDFYVLKDDHLSLSKPIFRQSFLYQRLLQVIVDSVESFNRPQRKDIVQLVCNQGQILMPDEIEDSVVTNTTNTGVVMDDDTETSNNNNEDSSDVNILDRTKDIFVTLPRLISRYITSTF